MILTKPGRPIERLRGEKSLVLVEIICKKCGQKRRAVEGSKRHTESICGNCWDWQKFPPDLYL